MISSYCRKQILKHLDGIEEDYLLYEPQSPDPMCVLEREPPDDQQRGGISAFV